MYISRKEEFLRLIDLCPFLATEKSQYDNKAVNKLIQEEQPELARLRHTFRCGIGEVFPLAVVIALGASLDVVKLMIHACPEALEEKLNGKRNVLHYAIAEGVHIDVIRYLTLQNPALSSGIDSFNAIPLHLAATYPSSSMCVLNHLLNIHPVGAKAKDYKAQTPLHRACRARASIDKVQALIEACPEVLLWKDWVQTTPLGWAERMDHSLSESDPIVIELLEMVECILTITNHSNGDDDNKDRAQQILSYFRTSKYFGGIRLAFTKNVQLLPLLDLHMGLLPRLLFIFGLEKKYDNNAVKDQSSASVHNKRSIESIFSVLRQCPDIVACGNV